MADAGAPPALHYRNPYTPGAGHPPPFLAGRDEELEEFDKLLEQDRILENVVLTGLRGVGKTVLLERFKALAIEHGWLWAGNDLSESASVTETNLALRLMTDLSLAATGAVKEVPVAPQYGFRPTQQTFDTVTLSFDGLVQVFEDTAGLVADKIKAVLMHAWGFLQLGENKRLVFAYDEAQNLSDHQDESQFPLSALLDVFQSIQKQGVPFMLVLTGLPTLFPKLVEARTYAERMFHVMTIDRLKEDACREAITRPMADAISRREFDVGLDEKSVTMVVEESDGYPYFVQFICREVFDVFLASLTRGVEPETVPFDAVQRKLDADFFSGRWAGITDRQRELLWLVSLLPTCDDEFTIQKIVEESKVQEPSVKKFKSSHVNQMLVSLQAEGLIYKNRFGKYSFAVPLMGSFIRRTYKPNAPQLPLSD